MAMEAAQLFNILSLKRTTRDRQSCFLFMEKQPALIVDIWVC